MAAEKASNAAWSTGELVTFVVAGWRPRKLPFTQFRAGLMGRGTNPPPQLGHTLCRTSSTHCAQNVHS
jgi:hypothetical protein